MRQTDRADSHEPPSLDRALLDDDPRARRQELARRIDRLTRVPMLVLAAVFLLVVILPEIADLPQEAHETLEAINWLIWAIFAFELIVMTYLAPDRRRYLRAHWIDVLTVLLPFIRPFRFLRVIILTARLWTEVKEAILHRTLSVVAGTSLVSAWGAATVMYMVERGGEGPIQTYPDALWWAAATITTVGYGDVYPKTSAGRGVALLLMLIGISIFGLLTARVAAIFVEVEGQGGQDETSRKLDEVLARLERLERAGAVGPARHPADDVDGPDTSAGTSAGTSRTTRGAPASGSPRRIPQGEASSSPRLAESPAE